MIRKRKSLSRLLWPVILSCTFSVGITNTYGQASEVALADFIVTGQTIATGKNCVRLTPAEDWSSGAIWYGESIDLSYSFEMELKIMFGCEDVAGADGIVFVFSPYPSVIGYQGEGMGFSGLQPSLGIEVDTWQNEHLEDPVEDHIAILQQGYVHHYYNLAGPAKVENVEDCTLHTFGIRWDHPSHQLTVYLDGQNQLSYNGDIVEEIFSGEPKVFWGITAATGQYNNRHEVCFEKLDFDIPLSELVFDVETRNSMIRGDVISLHKIQFETGSTKIVEGSIPDLHRLINLLKENPGLDLRINGHTDDDGSEFLNERLSRLRAQAVANFLRDNGVAKNRLHVKGYGEKYPVDSNSSWEGKMRNRRIDVQMYNPRA
ncbi:MAG: OmpA family protein [Saprospiraceae bacterium]|nr:OmpA family protein [Saprospiraceae bacterium]